MTFREVVGQAIGEASMCWTPRPTGEFDSSRAIDILERVMKSAEEEPAHGFIGATSLAGRHEETFETQLRRLLNTWSMERHSDTPDFVLCQFMAEALEAFSAAVRRRDHWYGFKPFDANAATNTPQPAHNGGNHAE